MVQQNQLRVFSHAVRFSGVGFAHQVTRTQKRQLRMKEIKGVPTKPFAWESLCII